MKKRNVLYIFLLSAMLCFSGCEEEVEKEVSAPIDAGSLLDKYADSESGITESSGDSTSETTTLVDPDSDVFWDTTVTPNEPASNNDPTTTGSVVSNTSSASNVTTTKKEESTTKQEQTTTTSTLNSGVTWTLSNGTLTISGQGEMKDNDWSSQRESITNVVIKDGVTSIRKNAFDNCTNLISITIPSSVTSIGYKAFYNCVSLSSIDIPSSVSSIGSHAFYGCSSLKNIVIPSAVTRIEAYTFYECSSLVSLTIPGSVTYIGDYALENCPPTMTIYGQKDSIAQAYALELYFAFVIR